MVMQMREILNFLFVTTWMQMISFGLLVFEVLHVQSTCVVFLCAKHTDGVMEFPV